MRGLLSAARTMAWVLGITTALQAFWPMAGAASWVEPILMPGRLSGPHASLESTCDKCHESFDKGAQSQRCLACHDHIAADLAGKRGFHGRSTDVGDNACKKCHHEHRGRDTSLINLDRRSFDHRWTDFLLKGAHTALGCNDCHGIGHRFREAPLACSGCHTRRDPHEEIFGAACENCHQETAWKNVRFDHATAAFRLEGRHRDVRCEKCHASRRFRPTPSDCIDCHRATDRHRGGFGTACKNCHTPRGWALPGFDHARRTKFPLVGSHSRVVCERCHKSPTAPADTPTACAECHAKDDGHRGQFGRGCESCHQPTEWRRPTFRHERDTRFVLKGSHTRAHCPDCHRGELHKEQLDMACYACHRDDDPHRGREGTHCEKCHDERGWQRNVLFDHATTRFALTGAHEHATCSQCHTEATFRDVHRDCLSCHARDDVHHGKEGVQCERCHDTTTFHVAHAPAP